MQTFILSNRGDGVVGILYIVATPIGNLEDVTLRALRILKEVGLIAAEDTRKARRLCTAYNIKTPLTSYHAHSSKAKLGYLLERLQERDVALISEAGMPGLSDPGYELVVAAVERDIQIVPIPGSSILPAALAVSGLPIHQFTYLGFVPRKNGERIALLRSICTEPRTIVAFEAPHRLLTTLRDLALVLGDRRIAVVRELTKLHEEVFRGTISQAREHFQQPRGEFTLIVEGHKEVKKLALIPEVEQELRRLHSEGLTAKEAISRLSGTTGLPKKDLYRAWLTARSRD